MIGGSIAQYTILEKLGEGGMGVVYKAQDTKLDRLVALKFLPHHLNTSDTERSRLVQEAKSAAALNHPNVCSVIDLVESGDEQFIVMEYVDGGSLRTKIPIQDLPQLLLYATQIGEALQEAHAKGIVHRDIKTDNIMINSRNQVKVMDFGLARLRGSVKLTRSSSTVGTLAYMSPEQIESRESDARSDIFSYGVVLYEMLTGRLPFRGEHEAAMMYSIMNDDPESLEQLRPGLPAVLVNIVNRALEKDAGDRFQSAGDIVIELRRLQKQSTRVVRLPTDQRSPGHVVQGPPLSTGNEEPKHGAPIPRMHVIAGAIAMVAIAALVYYFVIAKRSSAPLEASFTKLTDQPGNEDHPDISPDGNYIIYVKEVSGKAHIFMQRIGGGTPIDLLPESKDNNTEPAFSPDGQWILFRSDRSGGGLFIMGATGESVRRITDFGYDPAWSPDGKTVACASVGIWTPYARPVQSRLWSVDVDHGTRRLLDSEDGVQPQWSPHGNRIAFWGLPGGSGRRSLFTISSSGGDRVTLLDDGHLNWDPVWSPDGQYIYFSSDRGGSLNLWRLAIDEGTGKARGDPEPITTPSAMSGFLRVSRDGHRLVYVSIDHRSNLFRIGFDPFKGAVTGSPAPITEGSKHFIDPSVSPDGEWLTFWSWEGQESIYLVRKDGRDLKQLTNDGFRNRGPVWSPDQKRIAFYSDRTGNYQIWAISPDGSNLEQLSNSKRHFGYAPMWLPDGNHIVFNTDSGSVEIDLSTPFEARTQHSVVLMRDTIKASSEIAAISHSGLQVATISVSGDSLTAEVYSAVTHTAVKIPLYAREWLKDDLGIMGLKRDSDSLYVWNAQTGRCGRGIYVAGSDRISYELSPDNRTLYFAKDAGESDVWEATLK